MEAKNYVIDDEKLNSSDFLFMSSTNSVNFDGFDDPNDLALRKIIRENWLFSRFVP